MSVIDALMTIDDNTSSMIDQLRDVVLRNEYDFKNCATALRTGGGKIQKMDIVAACIAAKGNYNKIASLLGRSRQAVVNFIDFDPDLARFRGDIIESRIDDVESMQFELAEGGDGAAGRFILTTLGKERGYTTKTEVRLDDPNQVEFEGKVIDITALTDDELTRLADAAAAVEEITSGPQNSTEIAWEDRVRAQ